MRDLDFTIVVPVFNTECFLKRCAWALLAQDYPADRYEIFMVDNNSSDGSLAVLKQFDSLNVRSEAIQGSYAARNRAIREARGEIIAFTDSDCVPRPDWLRQIKRVMNAGDTGVVLGDRTFASDRGVLGMLASYESALAAYIFRNERRDCYYAYTNNMAVRTSLFDTLGAFENRARGADSLYLKRAIDTFGPSILRYAAEMHVQHLEISSVRQYLWKKFTYGRVSRRNRGFGVPEGLPLRERVEVARKTLRQNSVSWAQKAGFVSALAVGAAQFELARHSRC